MKKKIVAILTGMTLVMPNGIFVSASESQAGVESQAALENETFTSEQQDFDEESSEADVQSDEFSDEEAGEVFSDNVQDNNQSSKNDISIPGADLNEDDLTQNASASGTIVLGVKGSYIADIQAALDRINEIRKEACNEGVQDPRNPSRRLTSSDYVPIKWSSDLEYIARIRAAEASVYIEHTRPNGSSCWTVKSPDGEQSWGEVLAWNWSNSMVPGINQWYDEKEDWVKQNTSAVTGHYTQMIDPSHTYIGLSTFYNEDGAYLNTTCGEFSYGSGMDETRGSAEDNCTQEIEFAQSQVSVSMNLSKEALNVNETAKAELAIEGYRCKVYYVEGKTDPITWSSSDPAVASVDADGTVTGISDGTATITGKLGNSKIAQKTVTVTDKKDINDEDVEIQVGTHKYVYNGYAKTPWVSVVRHYRETDEDIDLYEDEDYTLTYTDNINAGVGHVTITGTGKYTGEKTIDFVIDKADAEIHASSQRIAFGNLYGDIADSIVTDGKISYKSSNSKVVVIKGDRFIPKDIGKATITITAAEGTNYKKLTKKITVTVYPSGIFVTGLNSTARGTATLTWMPGQRITGCQIQYSTQKNMKNAKTVTVNNKTKSYTMKKLSRNKKYYVRIRAYRTTGGQKYYSTWGSVRTVKVK